MLRVLGFTQEALLRHDPQGHALAGGLSLFGLGLDDYFRLAQLQPPAARTPALSAGPRRASFFTCTARRAS